MTQPFIVGVNYLPAQSGLEMWRRFDAAAIGDELAHIASLDLGMVRFFIPWNDFQPSPDRVDGGMLRRLETFIGLVADAKLTAMPTFAATCADTSLLPQWASDSAGNARDLYRGDLLKAQRVWLSEVASAIGAHPSIAAWDLSHRFSAVRRPSRGKLRTGGHETAPESEAVLAAWARALHDALRAHSQAPTTIGTWMGDLLEDRNVRLTSLTEPLSFASMQASSIRAPFARDRMDPEAVPFLASLAATFAHKAVLVSAFGVPICAPNRLSMFEQLLTVDDPGWDSADPDDPLFAPFACLTDDEAARYAQTTLQRLHEDGALGALWWCWSDFAGTVTAPHAHYQRACGLVRSDGSEKPVAAAISAFARERRSVLPQGDALPVGAEYFFRTLPTSLRTLYAAWLARS